MAPNTTTSPRSERPYNTRRKSLSLHSLGIHVPVTHAARAAAAANRERALSSPATMAASSSSSSSSSEPSSKKLKRAHPQDSDDAPTSEPLPKKREESTVRFENTPPPSPPAEHRRSVEMDDAELPKYSKPINMESINDDIVEAVIVQLQTTGNRPHIVKELAAVLMQQLKIVQQSANPCAIISSRLASFLKRGGWSAQSPCPLAKELESVHPRRTYFYLTTCPHQPLPDPSQATTLSQLAQSRVIISPAASTASSTSEDIDLEARRRELSPSPEVDLSSHEFDEMDDDMPSTPIGSYGSYGPYPLHGYIPQKPRPDERANSRRAASPALEKEEKEFTQTADGCRRKLCDDMLKASNAQSEQQGSFYLDKEEGSLFGGNGIPFASSPAIRPSTTFFPIPKKEFEADAWTSSKWEGMLEWDRSPENIELEELDGLLNDY